MSLSSLSSLSDEDIIRRRRTNKVKFNAFLEYDDLQFRMRFRVSKDTVVYLESLIGPNVKPITKRNRAIQPIDQILKTLRFYATGGYQRVIGDIFNVEQPTVHRIVHKISAEIAKLKSTYIKMPTPEERLTEANGFYRIAHFPRILGAVDCTHIKIYSPGGPHSKTFRNRKGYFSLNVQMVCDATLCVRNVIARWPGSVHDSTIFNDSPLCAEFERGDFGNMLLLGDSGYPCRSYLLTPILNPRTPAEEAYNRAQIKSRNPVERLFGVLKRRFPCLHFGLGHKVENTPAIIVACTVLHNIALSKQDEEVDVDENLQELINEVEEPNLSGHEGNQNFLVRNALINTHFTV